MMEPSGNEVAHLARESAVATVAYARPQLVDAVEATVVAESLGYTDARVRRELGFDDTHALGQFIFDRLADRPLPTEHPRHVVSPLWMIRSCGECVAAALVAVIPWLVVLAIDALARAASPAVLSPPLSLALMPSLVVVGGFAAAMSATGRFYFDLSQPAVASSVCGYFFRLGSVIALATSIVGLLFGWVRGVAPLPYLVLWADEFVMFSIAWLASGALIARGDLWRVPLAFGTGAVVFGAMLLGGAEVVASQLAAAAAVPVAAIIQVPAVLSRRDWREAAAIPLPRLTVVLFRTLPVIVFGAVFFTLVFAGPFRTIRDTDRFAWDLGVTSLLVAGVGIAYARNRMVAVLIDGMRMPADAAMAVLRRGGRRLHLAALGSAALSFFLSVALVTAVALFVRGADVVAWTRVALVDAGYLLVALAILNAMVLLTFGRGWSAVGAFSAGLTVVLTLVVVADPAWTLLAGAAVAAVWSGLVAQRALKRADYAIALV
jgi:hypothetical protein